MELFRELPRSSESDKCLEIGLWGSSKPLLSLLVASRLLVLTGTIVVGFQSYYRAGGGVCNRVS